MAPRQVRVAMGLPVMQLTGVNAGQLWSSEITHPGRRPPGPKGKVTMWNGVRQRAARRSRGVCEPEFAWKRYVREP